MYGLVNEVHRELAAARLAGHPHRGGDSQGDVSVGSEDESTLPELVHQEIWTWPLIHHALTVLITRAAEAADLDHDRVSFTRVPAHRLPYHDRYGGLSP